MHVALHPIRRQILSSLAEARDYATKLATILHMNVKLVQFHLAVLEKYGLVESEYKLVESNMSVRPVAVRSFGLTRAGMQIVGEIRRISGSSKVAPMKE